MIAAVKRCATGEVRAVQEKLLAGLLLGVILGVDAAYEWDRWIAFPTAPAAVALMCELLGIW